LETIEIVHDAWHFRRPCYSTRAY